jgi:FkbM family methyltransferase
VSYDGSSLSLHQLVNRPRADVEADIKLRSRSQYLGDQRALCWVLGRYMMFVDTTDVGFATHILMRGVWELWLTEYMIRTIRQGWTVLDVGANFGYYSLLLSDLVGHTGRCIAFEPNPAVAPVLADTLSVNGFDDRCQVRKVALSHSPGESFFYQPKNEPKNARLVDEIDQNVVDQGQGTYVRVPVAPLDIEFRDRVDFIKIDAEGAEGAIIQGMANVLRAHRPLLLIEYNIARMSDPSAPLDLLLEIYGCLRHLECDGQVYALTKEQVLNERQGSDWLLVMEP